MPGKDTLADILAIWGATRTQPGTDKQGKPLAGAAPIDFQQSYGDRYVVFAGKDLANTQNSKNPLDISGEVWTNVTQGIYFLLDKDSGIVTTIIEPLSESYNDNGLRISVPSPSLGALCNAHLELLQKLKDQLREDGINVEELRFANLSVDFNVSKDGTSVPYAQALAYTSDDISYDPFALNVARNNDGTYTYQVQGASTPVIISAEEMTAAWDRLGIASIRQQNGLPEESPVFAPQRPPVQVYGTARTFPGSIENVPPANWNPALNQLFIADGISPTASQTETSLPLQETPTPPAPGGSSPIPTPDGNGTQNPITPVVGNPQPLPTVAADPQPLPTQAANPAPIFAPGIQAFGMAIISIFAEQAGIESLPITYGEAQKMVEGLTNGKMTAADLNTLLGALPANGQVSVEQAAGIHQAVLKKYIDITGASAPQAEALVASTMQVLVNGNPALDQSIKAQFQKFAQDLTTAAGYPGTHCSTQTLTEAGETLMNFFLDIQDGKKDGAYDFDYTPYAAAECKVTNTPKSR
jgi:hypothetical protein